MNPVQFLTDFADEAVLLPLAGAVLLAFAFSGRRRTALAWILAVGGVMAATLVLKLAGTACAPCWSGLALRSASGHTAAGTAVYGGLAAFALRSRPGLAAGAALLVSGTIGTTRLVLGVHSVPEVVTGALLGLCGTLFFARFAGPAPGARRSWPVLAALVLLLVPLHGLRLPAEAAIRQASLDWWPFCRECRDRAGHGTPSRCAMTP